MEASVLDLRRKMKDIMAAIDRHEHVILTYRGCRRAVIIPLEDEKHSDVKVNDLPAFGMWANREDMSDPSEYVSNLRQPRGC